MARAVGGSERHGDAVPLCALEEKADGAAARATRSISAAGYVIITLPALMAQTMQQSIAGLKSELQAHREAESEGLVASIFSGQRSGQFGISSFRTRTQLRLLRHELIQGELKVAASSATNILQRCTTAVLDAVQGSLRALQGASNLASLCDGESAVADIFFYPPFTDCSPEPSAEIHRDGLECTLSCPAHKDNGLITAIADDEAALEVLVHGDSGVMAPKIATAANVGSWTRIFLASNEVVVLANRSLEVLSGQHFRACEHRVAGVGAPRLSVAYEVRLNECGLAAESKAMQSTCNKADGDSAGAYANAAALLTNNTDSDRTCMLL